MQRVFNKSYYKWPSKFLQQRIQQGLPRAALTRTSRFSKHIFNRASTSLQYALAGLPKMLQLCVKFSRISSTVLSQIFSNVLQGLILLGLQYKIIHNL